MYVDRSIDSELLQWKEETHRKPLILRGVRQCGKTEAVRHLVTGGYLFLEIGYDQGDAVAALMRDAGYYDVRTIKDYGGNDRIVCGIKSIRQ